MTTTLAEHGHQTFRECLCYDSRTRFFDLTRVRQILHQGNRAQGVNNGDYFTTELDSSKTEDIDEHLMNKEQPLYHAHEIIRQFVKYQTKIKPEYVKKSTRRYRENRVEGHPLRLQEVQSRSVEAHRRPSESRNARPSAKRREAAREAASKM